MPSKPKLRIFARPNGSGKSTLFDSIQSIYFPTQLFVNADLLQTQFINFSEFGLQVIQINN